MSNVVRLSQDTIDLLEEYRSVKINSLNKYVSDDRVRDENISLFVDMSLSSLINHCVADCIFWEKKYL